MVPGKLRHYAGLARSEQGRQRHAAPRRGVAGAARADGRRRHHRAVEFTGGADDPLLAPALAAGTTTVVKMPGQTAQTNAMVARIIAEAPSLPAGAVNIFSESGSEGARRLIDAAEVPVISFTGSSATGRAISAAGARHLKRFGLELGGKTPHLVFDDADLDAALPVLEKSLTVFAGQFCMTGSRLLVQRGVAERLRERLAQRLENLRVGPAADPRSDMGPLIDKANVERVERAVRQAIAAGAQVVVRGGAGNRGRAGGRRLLPSDPAGGR